MRANAIRAEFLGPGFPPLDSKDVKDIQTPTLLVTGQHSAGLFIQLANRLEELLPHAEQVKIAHTSHIVHEDDPPAYNKAVLSFLSKHP